MSSEVSLAGAQDDREPSIEELKRELVEAREQQAATSDILRIISGSSIGAQPVFDAIVASCQRLLRGGTAAITLLVDRRLKVVAFRRTKPEADAAMLAFSHSLDGHSPISVVARERTPFVIDDIETDTRVPAINRDAIRRRGSRSALFVPMLHQDKTVGTILALLLNTTSGSCKLSPIKPSSRSRTRDCSKRSRPANASFKRLSNSKQRPPMCSRLLVVQPSTSRRCSIRSFSLL